MNDEERKLLKNLRARVEVIEKTLNGIITAMLERDRKTIATWKKVVKKIKEPK